MHRITLRQVPQSVADRIVFNCNDTLYSVDVSGKYIIYSYGNHFPVAVYHDGTWTYNEEYYSPTTARHQHKVRMGMGNNFTAVDTATIKGMI